jgi:hypothetical protein
MKLKPESQPNVGKDEEIVFERERKKQVSKASNKHFDEKGRSIQ